MPKRLLRTLLYAAAAVGGIWLGVRFLLPWTAPFLVALALAALLEPAVAALCRRGIPRGAAAGAVLLLGPGALAALLVHLTIRGAGALTGWLAETPELIDALGAAFGALEAKLTAAAGQLPGGSDYLRIALDALSDTLTQIPATLSRRLLEALTRFAQHSPDLLLFTVTAALGSLFFSAAWPQVIAFFRAQLPPDFLRRLDGLGRDLKGSFGGWLRTQLILMVMTFFELLAAFLLLHVRGAGLIAGLTALIDALPIFGTGSVLVPWAAVSLLLGDYGRGIGLLIAWGVTNLVRSAAQAKLLGDQIGLDPLASLLALYMGWRICGVWGMLLFPLLFVTLQQLNDKGVLRLWRTP